MAMYQNSQKCALGSIKSLGTPTNHKVTFTRYGDEPSNVIESFHSSTPGVTIISIARNTEMTPPMGSVSESYWDLTLSGDTSSTVIYRCLQPIRSGNNLNLYSISASGLTPTVLWTNPSPTASFAEQSVNLTFPSGVTKLEDFTYYSVIARRRSGNYGGVITTGLVPTGNISGRSDYDYSILEYCASTIFHRTCGQSRSVGTPTTTFKFGDGLRYTTYGSDTTSTQNGWLIPYQIIGWK